MKIGLGAAGLACLLIFAVQAQGEQVSRRISVPQEALDWGSWTRPLGPPAAPGSATRAVEPSSGAAGIEDVVQLADVDVVDAHWMAMTMWGEARNEGEIGLRAVGHVIHNRTRAGGENAAFVTDTVSKAYQFSCWNPKDPNRQAMLNIDALPRDSFDYRMWLTARRLADEILTGRSQDPTGGSLFYHTTAVAPAWSKGVQPLRQIGNHLFFLNVN